jgi:hypothetical protein
MAISDFPILFKKNSFHKSTILHATHRQIDNASVTTLPLGTCGNLTTEAPCRATPQSNEIR